MGTTAVSSTMVGRDRELLELEHGLDDALAGDVGAFVVAGEAGIGKTRLLDEFSARAATRATVVTGQSVDLGDAATPYAPIVAILRSLVLEFGADDLRRAAGPGRTVLGLLLPEFGDEAVNRSEVNADRLNEVIANTVEQLSVQRPLVIVVEDLHWADLATLTALRFLRRALTTGRVLFVWSFRSDDVRRGHPLRDLLAELERSRLLSRIELRRLNHAEVAALSRELVGRPLDVGTLESLTERSEGVPFFIEELVGCDDGLPGTLRDILLARYDRLSERAQALLRLLSAGGVSVPHELLAEVAQMDDETLEGAAREAVLANVLVADAVSYSFRHALVREAIHDDLLPSERSRLHSRFADALQSRVGSTAPAAEIAYHWVAAHRPERALPACVAAMAEAKRAYAYGSAARFGEQALELWPQVPAAEELAGMSKGRLSSTTGWALRNAGEGERALALVDAAIEELDASDVQLYARLLRDKAQHLAYNGRPGSIQLFEQALELLRPGLDDRLRVSVLTELSARYMIEARFDRAVEVADRALAAALESGQAREASIASNMRASRVHLGQIDEGLADFAEAERLADGDGSALLRYRVNCSDILHLLGRYEDAVHLAGDGYERAKRLGVERSSGTVLAHNMVDPLIALGELDRADVLIERCLALEPPRAFLVYSQMSKITLLLIRGEIDEAARLHALWGPGMRSLGDVEMQQRLSNALLEGQIARATGRTRDAWNAASVLLSTDHRATPGRDLPLLALAASVLADLRRADAPAPDDLDETEQELRDLLATIAYWPTHDAWSALFDAELGGPDRTGSDVGAWMRAVETSTVLPIATQLHARLGLGRTQLESGDRTTARVTLTTARSEADERGFVIVRNQIDTLAHEAGLALHGDGRARSQPGTSSRPAGSIELTARERQVLELVAQGLSNRQIGEQLFISAKTASVHVSAILRKLGASTRTEAAFISRTLR